MDEPCQWLEVNRPIHCFLLSDLLVCTSEKSQIDSKGKFSAVYLFSFAINDIFIMLFFIYVQNILDTIIHMIVEELDSENGFRIASIGIPNRYTTLVRGPGVQVIDSRH